MQLSGVIARQNIDCFAFNKETVCTTLRTYSYEAKYY